LQPLPRGEAAAQLPIILRAQTITSQPDLATVAEGKAEFRRGGLVIRADRLAYDGTQDLASAKGAVRVSRDGSIYKGPELQLRVQRFEGYFLEPEFEFTQLGAGGRAARIDFLDSARSRATRAEYTSCPREGEAEPAWVLRTDSVSLDFDTNEGVAEGAVLRFLGTPILALPSLSFPLSDARKSGCRRRSAPTTAAASSCPCPTTGTSRRIATRRSRRASSASAASRWTPSSATWSRACRAA
jgi:LPS-assembly protein